MITQEQIASKYGKKQSFISDLSLGNRFTTDPDLAVEMAQMYGRLPIDYINPRKRPVYLKAYPKLGRPVRIAQGQV